MKKVLLRLEDDLLSKVDDYAKENDITKQEAYVSLLNKGLQCYDTKNNLSKDEMACKLMLETRQLTRAIFRDVWNKRNSNYDSYQSEVNQIKDKSEENFNSILGITKNS